MQFSASLLELEADVLYNMGHEERRESFVYSAYFHSGRLVIPLNQISVRKSTPIGREPYAILFSVHYVYQTNAMREQERLAQLFMSIFCIFT